MANSGIFKKGFILAEKYLEFPRQKHWKISTARPEIRLNQPFESFLMAIRPIMPTPFAQRPIIILGAGIIGCAAAYQLLQNGFQVTLVGEYLPGDKSILYASAWAGAAWHAAAGLDGDQKYIQAVTHRHLLKMALDDSSSGICIVKGREYLDQVPGKNSSAWGKTVLKNVSLLLLVSN